MDEYTADVFVNRDEPIPVLTVTDEDGSPTASASEYEVDKEGRRQRLRKKLSASRLKDKARQLGEEKAEGSPSLQDRLFNRYTPTHYYMCTKAHALTSGFLLRLSLLKMRTVTRKR